MEDYDLPSPSSLEGEESTVMDTQEYTEEEHAAMQVLSLGF